MLHSTGFRDEQKKRSVDEMLAVKVLEAVPAVLTVTFLGQRWRGRG